MAQDVVSGRHMEIEIGDGMPQQELHTCVVGLGLSTLNDNVFIFGAIDLLWREV